MRGLFDVPGGISRAGLEFDWPWRNIFQRDFPLSEVRSHGHRDLAVDEHLANVTVVVPRMTSEPSVARLAAVIIVAGG